MRCDVVQRLRSLPTEGLPTRRLPTGLDMATLSEDYWERVGWAGTPYPLPVWMHDREVEELVWQASREDLPVGHVVEVGCGWGASSFALARANEVRGSHAGAQLFCFDPFDDGGECVTFRQSQVYRAMRGQEWAHTILGTSDLAPVLFCQGEVRLALIDGDHSTEWARRDLENLRSVMAPGGVILLHDVHDPQCDGGPGFVYGEVAAGQWPGLSVVEPRICTLGVIRVDA